MIQSTWRKSSAPSRNPIGVFTHMARSNVQVADAPDYASDATAGESDGESTTSNGSAPAEAQAPKTSASVMVSLPIALKELIDAEAKSADETVAEYVRKLLAKTVSYTLPLPTPRGRKSKYAGLTPELAKAAKAQDQKEYQRKIKAMFAAVRAGEVDIESILAKYAADETAKAATAVAATA